MVGSFLNVCIYRIPRGESIVFEASHCTVCEKRLMWWELFPLFSWLLLGGKCSGCKSKISAQYPLVEATNALLWVAVFLVYGMTWDTLLGCLLVSALLTLSVIDARTKEIPPQFTIFIAILGVIRLLLNLQDSQNHVMGLLIVPGVLLLLFVLSRGGAIGGGDVKLMAGAGLYLGFPLTLFAFLTACVLGSAVHVVRMRFFGAGRELAMGPYLSAGLFLAMTVGQPLIDWYIALLGIA